MAVYVEIQTDAFAEELESFEQKKRDFSGVRRPLRGIEIKEDTYAVLKVIRANGQEIPLIDAGAPSAPVSGQNTQAASSVPSRTSRSFGNSTFNYSNFIIQRIVDSRQEKSQILETFGPSYIFFFGERPRVLQVEGLLFNTLDFNWRTEFWVNYENTLRGTKLVEQNARVYLQWDDIVVEGYIMGATAQDQVDLPYHIPFTFTLFVTNHIYLSQVGDPSYPKHSQHNIAPLDKSAEDAKATERNKILSKLQFEQQRIREVARADQASQNRSDVVSRNLFLNAIATGVRAQNLTFLSTINRFFFSRKVRFPKGIAGADAAAGPPQIKAPSLVMRSRRDKEIRSRISDNVDEYVAGGIDGPAFNMDKVKEARQRIEKLGNKEELEQKSLALLAQMGINPIQHGSEDGVSPYDHSHSVTVTEGNLNSGVIATARNLGFTV